MLDGNLIGLVVMYPAKCPGIYLPQKYHVAVSTKNNRKLLGSKSIELALDNLLRFSREQEAGQV